MNNDSVGEIIRKYREAADLSQEDLAEIIHVTKGKLVHWENNETIPRMSMVGRLNGALGISGNELLNAVCCAQEKRNALEEREQALLREERIILEDASQCIYHKRQAIVLLVFGIIGFVAGFLFAILTNSQRDTIWYFPLVIGVACAGLPFGCKLVFGNSFRCRSETPWEREARQMRGFYEWIVVIVFRLALFIIAYLVGVVAFPIVLMYHAYKAGKRKSLYRTIMFTLFVLVVAFYGVLGLFIIWTYIK